MMRIFKGISSFEWLILTFVLCLPLISFSQQNTRLVVLADMGNEPDEMQQIVHLMACSNELELEGLIAVTGKFLRPESRLEYRRVTHPELFIEIIDAYEKVLPNLKKHASGWQSPDFLRSIVTSGQPEYGIEGTGEGKQSKGSQLLLKSFEKQDDRPLWIVVNAGSNTLAQALQDFEKIHTKKEITQLLQKIWVFENGAQDNAGAWICNRFPKMKWIRSNYQTYAYGGPGSKSGDTTSNLGPNFWGNNEHSSEGQLKWLKENVMNNHGALGAVYPERRFTGTDILGFMEGGGTIPWMGLVNKGLSDLNHPSWGGWGGRFTATKVADFWSRHVGIYEDELKNAPFYMHREVSDLWTNPKDGKVYHGDYVPIWRWREAMFNDFKCRMDWCVQPFEKANHHPKAVFNEDESDTIIYLDAIPGEKIMLDASLSKDVDGDELDFSWWIYKEAGTYAGEVFIENPKSAKTFLSIPSGAASSQLHLILEVKDKNDIASLFDYRRIVIDVSGVYDHSDVPKQKKVH